MERTSNGRGWLTERPRAAAGALSVLLLLTAALCWLSAAKPEKKPVRRVQRPVIRSLTPPEAAAVLGGRKAPDPQPDWHPPHVVKVWLTTYRGATYRVTQLPRCRHLETLISYDPRGQTLKQAKARLGGIAASTGSFHNPQSMALADFLQQKGAIMCPARTGRCFVAVDRSGALGISGDYEAVKHDPRYSAIALGQRLVPLMRDGFTLGFMNRVTDRMAVGLNTNFIFIVQGRSSIWRLSEFMSTQLPVTSAINCDGGHVVRGRGPVHIVFRWKGEASGGRPAPQ